ncbi:MAG: hypothetical protein ACRCZK_00365 [Oscillospiraceae bacterium]
MKKLIIFMSTSILLIFAVVLNINKQQDINSKYIIKDFNNQIAVFIDNQNEPYHIYDIYLNNLPPMDITRIKSGIYAESLDDVNIIIEDYIN